MNKQKYYRYNKQTLQYQEIKTPLSKKILKYSLTVSAIAVYACGVWALVTPSSVKAYLSEKSNLRKKIESSDKELDNLAGTLSGLRERDNNLYRTTLALNHIDNATWDGGVGGSVKHPELEQLRDGKSLLEMANKMQKVKHQLTVVAESQDMLLSKAGKEEKRLRAIPSIRPLLVLDRPIHMLSGFGMRRDPVTKSSFQMHPGIDMGAAMGTPIFATGDGVVIRTEYKSSGYGLNVVIDHGYGYKTLYGHMVEIASKPGQVVKRGQLIGYVGSTGYSTAPHVHYEVFKNDTRIDPAPFVEDMREMSVQEFKELAQSVDPNIDFRAKASRGRRR
jgi:murein DD-endopeptidase MepM/ murein hydrolase activator NlpD